MCALYFLAFFVMLVVTVEIRCVFTVIQIIIQIAFEIPPRSLIANRVWRCNMTFTVIIAKMHKRGGKAKQAGPRVPVSIEVVHLHRRGHPWSPRGTVTLYTHSRSGHPAGRFPCPVCPVSPPGPIFSS